MTRGKALHRWLVARGWLLESKAATIGTHVIVFGHTSSVPRTSLHAFLGISAHDLEHLHVFDLHAAAEGTRIGTRLVDDLVAFCAVQRMAGLAFADASEGASMPGGGFWHAYAAKRVGAVTYRQAVGGCMTSRLLVVA
jgi:hypothetical protein